MAYTTETLIRLQTPFKSDTLITDAYITQKIAEADSIINSIIGEVYTLPLSEVPDSIANLSKEITSCLLYQEQNTNFEVEPGVSVQAYWDFLMGMLENIRTRKMKLYDTDGSELALTDRVLPKFYPTSASSALEGDESTAPKFTINQEY